MKEKNVCMRSHGMNITVNNFISRVNKILLYQCIILIITEVVLICFRSNCNVTSDLRKSLVSLKGKC